MTDDIYVEHIRRGKDPWKEEFNRAAKAIDMVLASKSMSLEEKVEAIENINESMNGRPHKPFGKHIHPKREV